MWDVRRGMMLMGFFFMNSYSHSCIYINSFFFLSKLQSFAVAIHSVSQSTRKTKIQSNAQPISVPRRRLIHKWHVSRVGRLLSRRQHDNRGLSQDRNHCRSRDRSRSWLLVHLLEALVAQQFIVEVALLCLHQVGGARVVKCQRLRAIAEHGAAEGVAVVACQCTYCGQQGWRDGFNARVEDTENALVGSN
jgi:hypothetical protein